MQFSAEDCWALRRGRPHGVDAQGVQVRCRHATGGDSSTSLCMPLVAHGELLGVLHLTGDTEIVRLQERAKIYAEHLSMALANLELRERLRDEAVRDPLTGLYNRRHTQEALERELHRASRTQEPIAVMMIDVDHFKKFNDNFGHQAGDQVLVELGKLLTAYTRGADVVSRMGGEELLIIMPGAQEQDAHAKAEQLRAAIAKLRVTHVGRALGSITISVGVAVYPRHGSSVDTLLRAADTALYRAKGSGRDRVVIAA
jgi:diguanylate cyclase (GGDEF)-like protein